MRKLINFNQFLSESFNVKKDSLKLSDSIRYNIYDNKQKIGDIILSETEYDHIGIKDDLGSDNIIYLSYVTIKEEHRGKKFFKRTLDWLVNTSLGKYDYIVLRVDTDSDVSFETLKKMYSKYGFKSFTPYNIDEYKYEFEYVEGEDNFMYYKLSTF